MKEHDEEMKGSHPEMLTKSEAPGDRCTYLDWKASRSSRMHYNLNQASDHIDASNGSMQGVTNALSTVPPEMASIAIRGRTRSSTSPPSPQHISLVQDLDGAADWKRKATRLSSSLQQMPSQVDSNNVIRSTSFSFVPSSCEKSHSRPRESWEMISDSYSTDPESENDNEEVESSHLKACRSQIEADNGKTDRTRSRREATTASTGEILKSEKQAAQQQHKEDKHRFRRQLSGLRLVTISDDDIWPSRQTQMTRAQALEEENLPTWPYKLNPLRRLGKRQKFTAKVAIAILIVGSAVGVGVGISGIAGGGAVQVPIKPKPIA